MNKILKILTLSGTVLGAIAPTAIKIDSNNTANDLHNMYENVEKMQSIVPKLSRINYQLNIDLSQDENVKFVTSEESGEQTDLSNEQTITYLDETLQQTNAEYEQLKSTLISAIKDAMDYLDEYRNNETELTNEQKLYIKEHSNSIKFLAETLEDLSEEVICAIDGCENCEDDEEFSRATNMYISTINQLEERIQALQSSLSSLQFINGIGNPYFYSNHIRTPNHIIYGLHYGNADNDLDTDYNDNNTDLQDNANNDVDNLDNSTNNDNIDNTSNNDNADNAINNDNNTDVIEEDTVTEVNDTNNTNLEVDNDNQDDKPTTFGLKSNIDTYGPTKRNIDTFFNTALYNNEYAYGGGNYAPYGYGGGYGYGMPYNNYYGHPYGMSGLNSNTINREAIQNQANNYNNTGINTTANVENEVKEEVKQTKKFPAKKAKNIDTYKGVTVQSNINTMGESKISKFFKEKFNNLRNKIRKQKDDIVNKDQSPINEDIVDDTPIQEESQIENTDALANTTDTINMADSDLNNDTNDQANNNNINDVIKEDTQIQAR